MKSLLGDHAFAYRPHQAEAIKFALSAFNQGKRVVIFEAPTGFGKSIANIVAAQNYRSTFYTSPQVALVDQLAADPLLQGDVDTVYGKANYQCIIEGMEEFAVDIAPCEKGIPCAKCGGKGRGGRRRLRRMQGPRNPPLRLCLRGAGG